MPYNQNKGQSHTVISVDAEKAFKKVLYPFMDQKL